MNVYIKKNITPILIEITFVISIFFLPEQYFIYSNFIFYAALLILFIATKQIDFAVWMKAFCGGKRFWIQVVLTTFGFLAAFAIASAIEGVFWQIDTGMIQIRSDDIVALILFALSTILLPAVVEETFYRKNLISLENKKIILLTTLLSMFLFALEHATKPFGIMLAMIWALPLSLSYIKTKNVHVVMTAHLIVSIAGNVPDIIIMLADLLR